MAWLQWLVTSAVGSFLLLLLTLVLPVLFVIGVWRIGTGLKALAASIEGPPGEKSLTEAVIQVADGISGNRASHERIATALERAPVVRSRQG